MIARNIQRHTQGLYKKSSWYICNCGESDLFVVVANARVAISHRIASNDLSLLRENSCAFSLCAQPIMPKWVWTVGMNWLKKNLMCAGRGKKEREIPIALRGSTVPWPFTCYLRRVSFTLHSRTLWQMMTFHSFIRARVCVCVCVCHSFFYNRINSLIKLIIKKFWISELFKIVCPYARTHAFLLRSPAAYAPAA